MKSNVQKQTAEARVVKKYHKIYVPLVELVQALQDLEPGSTLIDQAEFTQGDKNLHLEYTAKPVRLMINSENKKFTLIIEELNKDALSLSPIPRKDR